SIDSEQDRLHGATLSRDAEVETSRALPVDLGEVGLHGVDAGRREDGDLSLVPTKKSLNLFRGPANRRCRGDDFRADLLPVDGSGAELVESRLIEPYHRSEGAGDEMELVLDDEFRRPIPLGERCSSLRGLFAVHRAQELAPL